ncbi:MAG: glycosyltransferase family 2 protein [Crocinitomicaceae bacterium]
MEVAVVILNYNGENYLKQFLPSVLLHSQQATIWVVDNCSTDDSLAFLRREYPQVKIVENSENGGFAKGYNDGLKNICADYYILLNSDVEVTENWITPCIELMESDPEIAAVQPKILSQKNKSKFEHAGAAGGYLDKNYFPFCRGRIFEKVEEDKGQYDDTVEVFWATGACLFIRSTVFHRFNGFDEDFFAHMEEIDLCWRMKRCGLKVFACGSSKVYHVGGGTLNYLNPQKTYLNFRNSIFMIFKNHEGRMSRVFGRMMLDGLAATLFLFKLQFRHFWAVFRAHIALYRNWRKLKNKRKELSLSSTSFNKKGLYKKNIIFKKFLGGVSSFRDLNTKDFY